MAPYILGILITISIFALLAISLDLLIGYTGLFTIVHGALFGVGAYTAAIVALTYGAPFLVTVVLAGLASGLVSLLIAVPSIRISGHYLVLASFGVQEVLHGLLLNLEPLTGGPAGLRGIPRPEIFGWVVDQGYEYLILNGVVLGLLLLLCLRMARSPFGLLLKSVREDELLPQALGKDVVGLKIKVFALSGVIAGVAGALYAQYVTFVSPESFDVSASILILSMVLIGGMGTIWGALAGAGLIIILPELLRFLPFDSSVLGPARQIVYGAVLIAFCFLRPAGLLGDPEAGRADH